MLHKIITGKLSSAFYSILAGTAHNGVLLQRNFTSNVLVFVDAEWAADPDDCKSTKDSVFILAPILSLGPLTNKKVLLKLSTVSLLLSWLNFSGSSHFFTSFTFPHPLQKFIMTTWVLFSLVLIL